jgi:hypothetical protein
MREAKIDRIGKTVTLTRTETVTILEADLPKHREQILMRLEDVRAQQKRLQGVEQALVNELEAVDGALGANPESGNQAGTPKIG